ncbi:hypothetical protein V2S66_28950 [Streptomyces sp. V4-01]|uniref:Uncharacterized protein n=1 Tax=Actinacidiphila polyblastidii TaxID=3110430 RepID=A0ABU7PJH4_9ACTN|nr:hypothetical protein [Streptomyces sp. V4-01]
MARMSCYADDSLRAMSAAAARSCGPSAHQAGTRHQFFWCRF